MSNSTRFLNSESQAAFTLIELSIVLVIIGLIVGGVLVGRDLITAAAVRAQISQVEKYQQAVNTFKGKYGYLPGDIPDPDATRFGFASRGTGLLDGIAGAGDGNGVIEGVYNANAVDSYCGYCVSSGEPAVFWNDLSYANGKKLNLIDVSLHPSGNLGALGDPSPGVVTTSLLPQWIPIAKIGNGNFVYVWSVGGISYFGLSKGISMGYWDLTSSVGLTVRQAYNIDQKMDDGQPQTGSVIARYIADPSGSAWAGTADTSSTTASTTTCYDNATTGGAIQKYSLGQNNGMGVNCALSFKFQ